jgi:ankyrin repeat protein
MVFWSWTKTHPIHEAIVLGDTAKLERLLSKKRVNVNAENADGVTALHLAACRDVPTTALEALLAHPDINLNAQERSGKTPLHLAVCSERLHVVRRLLADSRTDVNLADHDGRSLLHYAVDFVKDRDHSSLSLLVAAPGVNHGAQDRLQRTALAWALNYAYLDMVIALTSNRDPLPEVAVRDGDGDTALHKAAKYGGTPLARLVKGQDRKVLDARNIKSETALHIAARHNSDALESLAHAGANLDARRDSDGANPFHIAAQQGSCEFVDGLRSLDPSLRTIILAKDNDGNTPLHLAAERGDSKMVDTILNLYKDPDQQTSVPIARPDPTELGSVNNKGEAAVELAARHGHVDAVISLLRNENINSDEVRSRRGEAILQILPQIIDSLATDVVQQERMAVLFDWATREGVLDIIKQLRPHADPSALERSISLAAAGRHVDVVRYLAEEGVNPNAWTESDGTPLVVAIERGHISVIEVLLDLEGVDPNRGVPSSDTPLMKAIRCRSAAVVSLLLSEKVIKGKGLLLDQGSLKSDQPNRWFSNPLLLASQLGYEDMVKMLVQPGLASEANLTIQDQAFGQTPLNAACWRGHWRVVEVLFQARPWASGPDVLGVDQRDDSGRTPFANACASSSPETVNLFLKSDLIKRKLVDPDSRDKDEMTPFAHACDKGSVDVLKLIFDSDLIKDRLIDPNARDSRLRTPLAMACSEGHHEAVSLFLDYFLSGDGSGLVNFDTPMDEGERTLLEIAFDPDDWPAMVLVLLESRLVDLGLVDPRKAYRYMEHRVKEERVWEEQAREESDADDEDQVDIEPLVRRLEELGCVEL